MKHLLFSILFLPVLVFANPYRQMLDSALKCEKAADKYIAELENKISKESQAYYGVICIMKSNHASFPFTKLKYFYRGKRYLELAILNNPTNMEYIYYRHEIQIKIPSGLGYNNKAEDLKKLKQFISNKENLRKDSNLYYQILKIIS